MNSLEELKLAGEAPEWMNEDGYKTLSNGYLLPNETPKQMYIRVAEAAASYYKDSEMWSKKFFDAMWKNWLCLASPVASNLGTDRGMPISCNALHSGDSLHSIFMKNHELAILSKNGAGVGIYLGDIRGRGATIKGNGKSEGIVPWAKVFDATTLSVSQGSTRRGASAIYLPIEHLDIKEFINIRRPTGDINRRCLNIHHGICISDSWMKSMLEGDESKRELWIEILKARFETGEPYLFFSDNVNNKNPECYVKNNLQVKTSNICCLSGDTLVLTKDGNKKIEELVGKTVEIYDGLNWIKNSSFELKGEDELYRIYIKDGSFVDCNKNHRWFVANDYNDIRNKKYKETLTENLKVGDFIENHDEEIHGDLEEPAAYLKGFLLGDGTYIKDRPMLNLHSTKYCCLDKLVESGNELEANNFNTNSIKNISFSEEKDNTGLYDNVYGMQKFKRMKGLSVRKLELFDWVSKNREELPKNCFKWNKKTKLEFLAGIFDSDGTLNKKSCFIQLSSKSKKLLMSIQSLLKTMAISSFIDNNENSFRITLSSYDSFNLLKELPVQRLTFEGSAPNRKTTGWRKISRIEKLPGIHKVYCPKVESTGKFALANGLMTGNSEITLYTDPQHTFVCCLSSLNLVRWDEWKDSDLPELATRFLDSVLSEYIEKTKDIEGMEASRNSAIKGRAIGIGVLGFHTLLQEKMIPIDSFDAMQLNAEIFRTIRKGFDKETKVLAQELGEPEWCKGFGIRNSHGLAVAPTVSNSIISGGYSAGIEPIAANVFVQKSAKGTFIKKNATLEKLLESKGKNTTEVWTSINTNNGSVQHLSFLSAEEKEVFLTAREINQHALIKLAGQRQKWIDQAQSLNLFFAANSDPKYIHEVHIAAWQEGLKTLYYLRSEGVIKGDLASRSMDECKACEG
jgi:ribonucleoside-diphosphate reductase alpha chain